MLTLARGRSAGDTARGWRPRRTTYAPAQRLQVARVPGRCRHARRPRRRRFRRRVPAHAGGGHARRYACLLFPADAPAFGRADRAQLLGAVLRAFGAGGLRCADGRDGAVLHRTGAERSRYPQGRMGRDDGIRRQRRACRCCSAVRPSTAPRRRPISTPSRFCRARHLAPRRWLPRVKAPSVFRFGKLSRGKPDLKRATAEMPPLLRTYLMMGGWVSDHAVIDRDLGTLHVFTGLEISAVPAGRARILRRLSAV
jgi:hypothetical protein